VPEFFNFLSWFHRKRVLVEVKYSGRVVQSHRVTNPYHAVSVEAGPQCIRTLLNLGGQRFLSAEAPPLPQPTCAPQGCTCHYVHHEDRRTHHDRRIRDVWEVKGIPSNLRERRLQRGRRATDHSSRLTWTR